MGSVVLSLSFLLFDNVGAAERPARIFDADRNIFRLDGGDVSYVFGVNERGELQSVHWGGRLQSGDRFPATHSIAGPTTMEATTSETPQEYGGWCAGLQYESALKITFPDGNRDLVLHYSIAPTSDIVARSAEIINDTKSPFTIEQAAAGLPRMSTTHTSPSVAIATSPRSPATSGSVNWDGAATGA